MDDSFYKFAFDMLRTSEGKAFAKWEIQRNGEMSEENRAALEERVESPDSLKGTPFEDAYLKVLKGSKDYFYAMRAPDPRDIIFHTSIAKGIFRPEPPKTDFPEVISRSDGIVELNARSWSFVSNLDAYAKGSETEESLRQFVGYLDVERELLILAPKGATTHADIMGKLKAEGRALPENSLPVNVSYHSMGDTYSITPSRSDDAGTDLTREEFDRGVALLRKRFFPFSSISPHAIWESRNPTINPFDNPYGHSIFVYIDDKYDAAAYAVHPMERGWKKMLGEEGTAVVEKQMKATFAHKSESGIDLNTVSMEKPLPSEGAKGPDDDYRTRKSRRGHKGSSGRKAGGATDMTRQSTLPTGVTPAVPLK